LTKETASEVVQKVIRQSGVVIEHLVQDFRRHAGFNNHLGRSGARRLVAIESTFEDPTYDVSDPPPRDFSKQILGNHSFCKLF